MCFLRRGFVSTSPNPQAEGPPFVGCPRLLIQFIHSYPPYRRPFLHPQPEDAPCRGDRNPHSWNSMDCYLQEQLKRYGIQSFSGLFKFSRWEFRQSWQWPISRYYGEVEKIKWSAKSSAF